MDRLLLNFSLAIEGVLMNRLRAILTALGVIFGVAAVIIMLAVGTGAKKAILEQMKLIGTNSIIVKAIDPNANDQNVQSIGVENADEEKLEWSPGLTKNDLLAIQASINTIEKVSSEIILNTPIIANARAGNAKTVGISNAFFELNNLSLEQGTQFAETQMTEGKAVCIIGKRIHTRFFQGQEVIGKKIKCGHTWLTIIGVLSQRISLKENLENLGLRDYNSDIYIPTKTALSRFENRAKIEASDIPRQNDDQDYDPNYHQIDRAVLQVNDVQNLQATADAVGRILKRRHAGLLDFEMQIPELLIMQQQKTQDTFNFVLVIIAAISLLVGGIGIMNIMLASVLERIKEIGIRRAVGASQNDITQQFIMEAVFISLIGGIIGAILGITCARIIAVTADIPTTVTAWSIAISFGVAFMVGTIFGLLPAQRAAKLNPITALRSE